MENPRPEKVADVEEIHAALTASDAVLLTEYRGMTVASISKLRRILRPLGAEYKVYKNTLVNIAADRAGIADLAPLLHGPTAVAFVTGDAVEAAKALREFAKTEPKLIVKGGVLGNKVLDAAQTAALADMPPRAQVLAEIAGLFEAPLSNIASLLEAPVRDVAYAIAALEEKLSEAA
jgi:large subunit ribosomal protein L10